MLLTKTTKNLIHGFLFAFCLIIFLFLINQAKADIGITVYPLSYKIVLSPGQEWEGMTTIVNPNDFVLKVIVEKENIRGGAEGSISLTSEDLNQYGLAKWISYDVEEFELQPKQSREFHYKIKIPENAPPGGHYAAVLFKGKPAEEASGIGISGRTGTVILVEVTGDVVKQAKISSIQAPKFIDHGPLTTAFKILNEGNTYIAPEGKVVISGLFQKQELAIDSRVVFPGFDRTFAVKWDRKYFFGPLNVVINTYIPNGPAIEPAKIVIWAFPYQEAILIVVIILLIVWGIKLFKKKFKIVKVEEKPKENQE
ncbi:MAG: hypothetical protein N2692_02465 [Patescibacteria group bacterium]|jgi:hypothetical protein|nr:hypothetical protein [Patescibacteria group bacterium]